MPRAGDRVGVALRALVLVALFLAPLLAGAVHEPVFVPLLVACALAGTLALARSRGRGHEPLPGARLILALLGLVLFQLLPLPPAALRLVSPGSFDFWSTASLGPLAAWRPISVSPPDTLRGLAFAFCLSLLYVASARELAHGPWRRRVAWTIAGAGLVMTLVALVQSMSAEPRRVWGVWQPRWDWAVFGPYVNRNHFAGYLVMAAPLALGLALEAAGRLRAAAQRRRRGWLALGGEQGNAAVRSAAVAMALVAGLLASGSRGGIAAFLLATLALPLVARQRRATALGLVLLVPLGVAWIGLGGFVSALETRGVRTSRLELWQDMLPMVPRFPLFGAGLDAFATAYPWFQTIWKTEWIGEAHNEYLQVLLDTGLVGALLAFSLLAIVFRRALARAGRSPVELGVFGALLGLALHNLVDFNWQIPANAAAWTALAGLAAAPGEARPGGGRARSDAAHPDG